MGAVTILLIALAAIIMFIMYRVADGGDGSADAVVVASGGLDAAGAPPTVGAKPESVDLGAAVDRAAQGRRRGLLIERATVGRRSCAIRDQAMGTETSCDDVLRRRRA
jgi:hypothetical protein